MLGSVWNTLVGCLLASVGLLEQKYIAVPYIAFLDQRLAAVCSEFPSGPVEQLLAVLARTVSLRVVPSICLVSVESVAVSA